MLCAFGNGPDVPRHGRHQRIAGLSMPCMVYGGAQVVKDGNIIYDRPVDSALTHEILNWAHENGIHAQVYENQCVVFEKSNRYSDDYEEFYEVPGVEQSGLRHRKDIQSPKVLLIGEPEDIVQYEKMARARFGERLQISRSKPHFLELNNPNANKETRWIFWPNPWGSPRRTASPWATPRWICP